MRWPWRTEKRQQAAGAYTDAIVSLLQSRAGGVSADSGAIAALEIASGLWARGFASAEVSPEIEAVSPSVLASIGRQLVRRARACGLSTCGAAG